MLPLLLFISLLLHLVSFIILRSLYLRVNKAEPSVKQLKQTVTEMEELLVLYLQEMKEENNYLLVKLKEIKKTEEAKEPFNKKEDSSQSGQPVTSTRSLVSDPVLKSDELSRPTKPPMNEYIPPLPTEQQDSWEQSMAGKVLTLYEQGKSVEEIAKKLNSGKAEVQLLLKFHQKNS